MTNTKTAIQKHQTITMMEIRKIITIIIIIIIQVKRQQKLKFHGKQQLNQQLNHTRNGWIY